MTQDDTIKTRADGSIDIEHYTRIGRRMRSEQAVGMLSGGARSERRARRKGFGFFGLV